MIHIKTVIKTTWYSPQLY